MGDQLPLSIICSNLAKAAEKQRNPEGAEVWGKLAVRFDTGPANEGYPSWRICCRTT
jgi:hypothetical protein